MKTGMNFSKLAVVAAVVLSASALLAQGPGGRRGGFGGFGGGGAVDPSTLLAAEPVQKELELTDDQKASVTKMGDDRRTAMQELFQSQPSPEDMQKKMADMAKENKKKVADLLLPPQVKRLDEIALQFAVANGFVAALAQDDLAQKLALTDDQKSKVKDFVQENQDKTQEIFQNAQGDFQGAQEKMTKLRDELKDKAMALLTADQKTTLEKLEGKKFDVSTIQLRGGRGRRGGAGGPPPGGAPGAAPGA